MGARVSRTAGESEFTDMAHRLVRLALLLLSIAAAPSSADAHHSHPYFYDECRSMTIEGRLESVDFKDPHTWIVLRLDDGTAYGVDWAPMNRLTNERVIGAAKVGLVPGARVMVTGNRIRNIAEIRAYFPDFKGEVNPNTVDPTSIRRVGGSFNWARSPRTTPPNCGAK